MISFVKIAKKTTTDQRGKISCKFNEKTFLIFGMAKKKETDPHSISVKEREREREMWRVTV